MPKLESMRFLTSCAIILLVGCSQTAVTPSSGKQVTDFKSCVAAGFPVVEADPAQCFASDNVYFAEAPKPQKDLTQKKQPTTKALGEKVENPVAEATETGCKNLCGDGICQQIVCQASGCPCAEDPINCAKDCVVHP